MLLFLFIAMLANAKRGNYKKVAACLRENEHFT